MVLVRLHSYSKLERTSEGFTFKLTLLFTPHTVYYTLGSATPSVNLDHICVCPGVTTQVFKNHDILDEHMQLTL